MRLSKLYELMVSYGIAQDPRGTKINEYFKQAKGNYRKLKGAEKECFDREALKNPFADTRILYGSPDTQVKKALVGIDI